MVTREQLYKEIDDAHRNLLNIALTLEAIAGNVSYMHPQLADDLYDLAGDMEQARRTIQGNHAHMVNLDLQASQKQIAGIFTALLQP